MSIEQNIKDFERELEEMKESLEAMSPCVDDEILAPIESVISEYENHLKPDIESLMNEAAELQDKLDEVL